MSRLVSRFRSSHHCAAHSFANFGIKGTLAIYDSSAVFGFEVPTQTRGYNDRNFKSTALVRTADAEFDGLFQRLLHRRGGKQRQRIGGYGAVMARALDRVFECAMLGHQADGMLQIGIGRVAVLEGAAPERPLALRSPAKRQDDGQRDLAFAKIIADVLAELGGLAAIVERIIHELKGDAEIHAERAAGRLLVLGA